MAEENMELIAQVASTRRQLEETMKMCESTNNIVGVSACKIALSAIKVLESQQSPPQKWEPKIEFEDD